jgi:hypothetical protein
LSPSRRSKLRFLFKLRIIGKYHKRKLRRERILETFVYAVSILQAARILMTHYIAENSIMAILNWEFTSLM